MFFESEEKISKKLTEKLFLKDAGVNAHTVGQNTKYPQ